MRYITITSPVSSFAEAVRQDSARTRDVNLAIAAAERQVAKALATQVVAEAETTLAKASKEGRKAAIKALALAKWMLNSYDNPKFL